ncbi:uncharacterized protein ACWYII_009953 isoform 3-T3 [Salvelinus alpinus]|uniref:uncharacterized protein isoform X3 n=1 Tax=Salvelinus alpinus TaxID=8036 RepID=UPI0039FC7949
MLSPRRGVDHRPAATLLTQVAVIAMFVSMSACMPGSSSVCPRSLDCARARRHFCQQGSSHCGPCLTPLVENSHGRCIVKRRPSHAPHFGKVTTFPEVDEEIDFLSTIISQQETESGFKHPASSFQDVPKVKEEEDDRSMILTQRPTTEQPTTHGATTASPPTSITTANTTTTSHTPAVRSGPHIIPYPSNSRVFISCREVCDWLRRSTTQLMGGWGPIPMTTMCLGIGGWLRVLRCTTTNTRNSRCSAWRNTGMNPRCLTPGPRQMRRMRMGISRYTSALDWPRRERWR